MSFTYLVTGQDDRGTIGWGGRGVWYWFRIGIKSEGDLGVSMWDTVLLFLMVWRALTLVAIRSA